MINDCRKSHLQTNLIAKIAGLNLVEPDLSWQSWVDDLYSGDADKLQGFLIRKFGRSKLQALPKNSKLYCLDYLTALECEFSFWLSKPKEIIDYVIASRCAGKNNSEVDWFWLEEHQKIWTFRGYNNIDVLPNGIRLFPIIDISLENILSRYLNDKIEAFFHSLINRDNTDIDQYDTEQWLFYVESGCEFLGYSAQEFLGSSLKKIKDLRKKPIKNIDDPYAIDILQKLNKFRVSLPAEIYIKYKIEFDKFHKEIETKESILQTSNIEMKLHELYSVNNYTIEYPFEHWTHRKQ
jgi:hypothetical protein